jgi:hypothetical protein
LKSIDGLFHHFALQPTGRPHTRRRLSHDLQSDDEGGACLEQTHRYKQTATEEKHRKILVVAWIDLCVICLKKNIAAGALRTPSLFTCGDMPMEVEHRDKATVNEMVLFPINLSRMQNCGIVP